MKNIPTAPAPSSTAPVPPWRPVASVASHRAARGPRAAPTSRPAASASWPVRRCTTDWRRASEDQKLITV